jgi:hypothetical protein
MGKQFMEKTLQYPACPGGVIPICNLSDVVKVAGLNRRKIAVDKSEPEA